MANLFANLPLPALNGPGAAVDVSGMGSPKTIVVAGDFVGATIAVEVSVDGGTVFAPVSLFQTGDSEVVLPFAAQFMRVNVSGRKTTVPFAAAIDVASNDFGATFAAIAMPALNGPGTAVNVSTLGLLTTMVAGGSFQGATITVEGSEDGVAYAPIVQFAGQGGLASRELTANWIRANVKGRKTSVPFTGSLAIGAVNDPVGVAGIDVENQGAAIPNNPHTILNFTGAGVVASDAGAGRANITIPGRDPTLQCFTYTVTGAEPVLSELVIPLPVARANTLYQVFPAQGQATFGLHMNVQTASKQVGQFTLSLSGDATAGDVFAFQVLDPT